VSLVVRFLHVLGAITWVGGMLFIALTLVPATRGLDPLVRASLVSRIGVRFRLVGWFAVALLLLTGLLNLWFTRGMVRLPRFQVKLALVAMALALSVVHDFVLGPRAAAPGADPALRARALWVARINTLIVLAVVALGLSLRR
jgi:putative copper export protein